MPDEPMMPEAGHLPPEIFVDLLEGAPVEARFRQHAGECGACQAELAALGQTIAELREEEASPAAGAAEAPGDPELPLTLAERAPASAPASRWWLTAAAMLLLGLSIWWFREVPLLEDRLAAPTSAPPGLLPPTAEDEDFQFLLAVSQVVDESVLSEAEEELVVTPSMLFSVESDQLSPEERGALMEELAEVLRAESS